MSSDGLRNVLQVMLLSWKLTEPQCSGSWIAKRS
jgi:hypothetical protein